MKCVRQAVTVAVSVVGLSSALVVSGTTALAAAPVDPVRTVATGFAGPLNVSVAPNGQIYVADAFAGQIVRVDPKTGIKTPVVASPAGTFTPGVDVKGGQIFFTSSAVPDSGEDHPPTPTSTSLLRATPSGEVKPVADLLAYEIANNPDGQPQDGDSNPYAVLALPGRTLVADAAGNDIVEIRADGRMRTLTVLPVSFAGKCAGTTNNGVDDGGCDPVPTGLALGPDGFLYVSGLGGEGAEGFIWKIDPRTGAIVDTRGGLPPLTGVAVAPDGSVYAASLFADTIFRFAPDGAVSVAEVTGPTGLDFARGVLYATTLAFGEFGPSGMLVTVGADAFAPAG